MTALPRGFSALTANIGIKDASTDVVIIACEQPAAAAGVFTRSRFAGASVEISRAHIANSRAQAMIVISKNANVATGNQGFANAMEIATGVADAVGCDTGDVLVASTGVIGRQYPMDNVRAFLDGLHAPLAGATLEQCATAIMTTDTHAKLATAMVGAVTVAGIAKGVGMIEPDMATLIAVFMTDAALHPDDLDSVFRRVMATTFNAVSIDTDTSTSDTAVIIASGSAGPVAADEFEAALSGVALTLTKMVARDGEGATKLLSVTVTGARNSSQAKRVAKSIVNSPLVKTAVHGADPNWGRVAMAIGKCSDDTDIDPANVSIAFGDQRVFPDQLDLAGLDKLSRYMQHDDVTITCNLGIGDGAFTVYGCDLSDQYIRINADYTT
jgi:glutamate N-acetyltransferase / amino-acid N-acetyltransferase